MKVAPFVVALVAVASTTAGATASGTAAETVAAVTVGADNVESSPTPLVLRLTVMLMPTAVRPTVPMVVSRREMRGWWRWIQFIHPSDMDGEADRGASQFIPGGERVKKGEKGVCQYPQTNERRNNNAGIKGNLNVTNNDN